MTELKIYDDKEDQDMKYKFSLKEKVLFEIVYREVDDPENTTGWDRFDFVSIIIQNDKDDPNLAGAASYEHYEGGVLEEHIIQSVVSPDDSGIYALDNVTGTYTKGDWGFTEDEMQLEFGDLREATDEEKREFEE